MAENKVVRAYKRRRTERLKERGIERFDSVGAFRERRARRIQERMDAGIGWAYGIAKENGIDTTGMTPEEVFEALEKIGKGPKSHGKKETVQQPVRSLSNESNNHSNTNLHNTNKRKGKANELNNGNASRDRNESKNQRNNRRYVPVNEASNAEVIGGYRRRNNSNFRNGYGATNADPADKQLPSGVTMAEHTDDQGEWDEEREALHSRIIDETFAGVKKASGKPVTTFMGGGPASGKSYVVKSLSEELGLPGEDERILVDPDRIKTGDKKKGLHGLPEYDPNRPGPVHEESSALAKRITQIAQENGYNVLVDGTGDGSAAKMKKKIRQAKEAGHTVNGVYTFVPMETALVRNYARDRSVDDSVVVDTHKKITKILPEIASEFDSVKLYSNAEDGKPPRLVAYGGGGKGLTIVDQKLYRAFLANGDYQYDAKRATYLRSLPESQKKTK